MFWTSKKNPAGIKHLEENQKRERLFFHDIINQTHGLLLFLNQRQNQKTGIEASEINMLEREVRTLQSLIKDHYHFKHKNLASTYDWVPFPVAEGALKGLIANYLPNAQTQSFIHYKGDLALERAKEERESAMVYFPAFYRIMNNLIKNMAEAHSAEVHFYFDYNFLGLNIETQNKFMGPDDLKNISDKLSQIILDEKPTANGLGLESIHHLALECGGLFEFEINNELWINHIFLPAMPVSSETKKAA